MGERFWTRVALAGCVAAGALLYWPAIAYAWAGNWSGAAIAAVGTTALISAIYWFSSR